MGKKGTWRGLAALGMAVAGVVMVAALTSAQGTVAGKLEAVSPSQSPSPKVPLATEDVSGAKGPHCGPKFIGAVQRAVLDQMDITGPDMLAVEMEVIGKPLLLHNLKLQLYSEGQVVWESEPECGGCVQEYPVSGQGGGYYFRLDPTGVAVATQLYPQATAVGLSGMAHDGYLATFSFVRLDPAALKGK